MSRIPISPQIRELVERLTAHEAADSPVGRHLPVARVLEKLRLSLITTSGRVAFRSLLAASKREAALVVPPAEALCVTPEGLIEGWDTAGDRQQMTEAGVVLVSRLLSLLSSVVGETVVLRLVLTIAPDVILLDVVLPPGKAPRKGPLESQES
jgi:hypothetical protein